MPGAYRAAWPSRSSTAYADLFTLASDEAPLLADSHSRVFLGHSVRWRMIAMMFISCQILLVLLLEAVRGVPYRLPAVVRETMDALGRSLRHERIQAIERLSCVLAHGCALTEDALEFLMLVPALDRGGRAHDMKLLAGLGRYLHDAGAIL